MKQFSIIFFLMCLTLAGFSQKEAKLIRKGNSQFKKGEFKEAEINYRKSLELNAKSTKGEFNLGDALYSQENYEESAKVFDGMKEKITDVNQKSEVYHNLGNSLLESDKYKESIEAYKHALRSNPNDMDTKYNLAYARQKLKEQEDQNKDQQQDKQDQDQDQQEDKKDQEKEQDQNKEQEQKEDEQDQKDQQGDQKEENQQKPQPKQISKKDAERMLEALKNEEKKTLEKLKKEKAKNAKGKKVEKDW